MGLLQKMGSMAHKMEHAMEEGAKSALSAASRAEHALEAGARSALGAVSHAVSDAIHGHKDEKPKEAPQQSVNKDGENKAEMMQMEGDHEMSQPQPAIFISMGSPALLIETSEAHAFFRELGMRYNYKERKPACIVCVSARWISDDHKVVKIMSNTNPRTVHDFNGFADCIYNVEYLASGSSDASARIAEALTEGGFDWEFDGMRGFDFGCWSPLALMFPDASVPIVQVSIHGDLDPRTHVAMGEALAPLRDEGYLLLCSGGITHNLLELSFGAEQVPPWAAAFDGWVQDILLHEEHKSKHESYEESWHARNGRLAAWMDDSEGVQSASVMAHPTPENFLALLVAAGSGGACTQLHHSWAYGSLSMASYMFGPFPLTKAEMDARPGTKEEEEEINYDALDESGAPIERQVTSLSALAAELDDEDDEEAEIQRLFEEENRPPSRLGTGNRSAGSRPPTGGRGSRPHTRDGARPPDGELVKMAAISGDTDEQRYAEQMEQLTSRSGPVKQAPADEGENSADPKH